MQKAFKNVTNKVKESSNYQKFTDPKVSRGKTAFPSGDKLQKQLGVRYDYDGESKQNGVDCHKFQLQPNSGNDIPSAIKRWREANGGTHKVMATVYVKKNGTKEDVEKALNDAHKGVSG